MKNQLLKNFIIALVISNNAIAYESAMTQEEIEKARAEYKAFVENQTIDRDLKQAKDAYNAFKESVDNGTYSINLPTQEQLQNAKNDYENFKKQLDNGEINTNLIGSVINNQNTNTNDELTGDAKLACEAILCLSSSTRPSECNPSLHRYFSIKAKKSRDTIRKRKNFLKLCPVDTQSNTDQNLNSLNIRLQNNDKSN